MEDRKKDGDEFDLKSARIGINGRTFSNKEPGGDVGVAIKHGKLLSGSLENTVIFGHTSLSEVFENSAVNSKGYFTTQQVYGLFWDQTFLPYLARKEDLDLLYCPSSYCPLQPTSFDNVVAIQDIPSYHGFGNKSYRKFRKLMLPRVSDIADQIITVSEFTRKDIISHLNVPEEKVSVVYNGIDPIYLDDESVEESVDLPNEYLLFVGAKSKRKNIQGVVDAYRHFHKNSDKDIKLVIAGPSSNSTYDPQMQSFVESSTRIIHTGYLTPEQLKYTYRNARMLVFPSRHESFGLPPLEAAACGTPTVTTRTGAIPEILGENAIFVDPEDTISISSGISFLIENKEKSDNLSNRAKNRAQKFDWENSLESLRQVLFSVYR